MKPLRPSARVQAARDIQNKRFANGEASDIVCNADMRVGEIQQFCRLQARAESDASSYEPDEFISASLYTARCHHILKISPTIADLAGSEEIQSAHLAEALQYRPKIMMG